MEDRPDNVLFRAVLTTGLPYASVAELVDALDSKSSGSNTVWVRFPPEVLKKALNLIKVGPFAFSTL